MAGSMAKVGRGAVGILPTLPGRVSAPTPPRYPGKMASVFFGNMRGSPWPG